jgi:hypothetical protein
LAVVAECGGLVVAAHAFRTGDSLIVGSLGVNVAVVDSFLEADEVVVKLLRH